MVCYKITNTTIFFINIKISNLSENSITKIHKIYLKDTNINIFFISVFY